MNSSPLQGYLTLAATLLTVVSAVLVAMGCTQDAISGALNCTASSLPVWLAPWAVGLAALVTTAKTVIGVFTGKLLAKTAIIDPSGKAGTVTQAQVDAEPKK